VSSRILITGGAGFIGYHLASYLAGREGCELTLIDDLSRGRTDDALNALAERANVRLVTGDLTRPDAFDQLEPDFDYIYHMAAIVGVKNVVSRPRDVLNVNALATIHCYEFAARCPNLKRVLFASTSEVYAGTLKHFGMDVPTPETTPIALDDVASPRCSYALSKLFGEAVAASWREATGLPSTVVRFHNVYGPRMGFFHVMPEMFVKVMAGGDVDLPSPEHTRAFCYVDDAVKSMVLATEAEGGAGQTLNVGNGSQEVEIRELAATIARVLGRDVRFVELPETPGSPRRRCPNTEKIEAITGFVADTSLEHGIEATWDWYRDRLDDRYE